MNGGSVCKGKPHSSSKAKSIWRYECMQFEFWALTQIQFNQCCASNKKCKLNVIPKTTCYFIINPQFKRVDFIVFVLKAVEVKALN